MQACLLLHVGHISHCTNYRVVCNTRHAHSFLWWVVCVRARTRTAMGTTVQWHAPSATRGAAASRGTKAKLLLLKLIHLFARAVLLSKKQEIEETKTT